NESIEQMVIWGFPTGTASVTDMVYGNGFIYFAKYKNGLHKANVLTGEITTLIEPCSTKYYAHLSIAPDGKYLIAEKIIYDPLNGYDIVENHEIWKISLDSCYQERILGN